MAKNFILKNLFECPHCGEKNTISAKPLSNFKSVTYQINCWNSEKQKGCMKLFNCVVKVGVYSERTDDQKTAKIQTATADEKKRLGL